ncbi:RNA polymerase sigma factor [Brumimicrobium mesophilum]|uniref:RNA polymerase sigma factor n=1 Tax=Brumimicrobium mesophilum TaxID=392717 RepID=UPI000D1440FE|nr:RNA polymerase sigma factor [Brumimicrobium mesophilum]
MTNKQISDFINGDKKAFDCIYEQFAPAMFAVCIRYTHCKDDAQEVLQISFIKIYEARNSFNEERPLAPWIKSIVINSAINFLKKQRKMVLSSNENDFSNNVEWTYPEIQKDDLKGRLMLVLQQLPDGYRTVFNLFVLDNLSHIEIAEHLGISVGTSKSQLSKARSMIQKLIQERKKDERA